MAEGLFRAMVRGREDFIVESAGVHASQGQRASQHTVSALKEVGVDLTQFRSQPMTKSLISDATHIFVMTEGHREIIEALYPKAADKTYLVTEFCADDELRGADLPDPIGLGKSVYTATRQLLSLPYHEAKDRVQTDFERQYFAQVMKECGFDIKLAEARTGLSMQSLYRLLKKSGLRLKDLKNAEGLD